MKKRSFWLIMFAFILILPAMFVLSACEDHLHTFDEKWTSDNNYHWHTCVYSGCDVESKRAEHTFDDGVVLSDTETVFTCMVCKQKVTKQTQVKPTNHVWNDGVVTKEPTCTTAGTILYTCTDCGETKEMPIAKLEHSFTVLQSSAVAATCTSNGKTAVYKCANCSATSGGLTISALGHNYIDGVCSRCGKEETTEHTHSWVKTSDYIAPTEHTTGKNAEYACSVDGCEETKGGEILEMLHHVEHRDATVSTCITNGRTEGDYCSDCSAYIQGGEILELDKTNHESSETITKNVVIATCKSWGYTGDICYACCEEVISKGEYLSALEHTLVEIVPATVTCEEDGESAIFQCTVCQTKVGGYEVEALGHAYSTLISEYVAPGCETNGASAKYQCTRCSSVTGGETISKIGHIEGNPTFVYTPKDDTSHYVTYLYNCARCQKLLREFKTTSSCDYYSVICDSGNFSYSNGYWYCSDCNGKHTSKPSICATFAYYCSQCKHKVAIENTTVDNEQNLTSLIDKFLLANDCESSYLIKYNEKYKRVNITAGQTIYVRYDDSFFEIEQYMIRLACEHYNKVFATINSKYRIQALKVASSSDTPTLSNEINVSKQDLSFYKFESSSYSKAAGLTYTSKQLMSNGEYSIEGKKILMNINNNKGSLCNFEEPPFSEGKS